MRKTIATRGLSLLLATAAAVTVIGFLSFNIAAKADPISGEIIAYDGDGIYVQSDRQQRTKIRLWGIDAPELGTTEGERSFVILQRQNGKLVSCHPPPQTSDYPKSFDRLVARCVLDDDGRDLAAMQIESGNALEWLKFSKGYYGARNTKK